MSPHPQLPLQIYYGSRLLIGEGNRNTDPDEETTKKILEGCKDLAPELLDANGEFRVLSALVGLRPARKGGPRVEREVLEGVWLVVHCYGHAGAG